MKMISTLAIAGLAVLSVVSTGRADTITPQSLANGVGIIVSTSNFCKTTLLDNLNSRYIDFLNRAKAAESKLESDNPDVKKDYQEGYDEQEKNMFVLKMNNDAAKKLQFCADQADLYDTMISIVEQNVGE